MKQLKYLFLLMAYVLAQSKISTIYAQSQSQLDVSSRYFTPANQQFNFRFAVSFCVTIQGGSSISIAAGSWVDNFGFQPALTSSLNFYFHGDNLGNAQYYGEQDGKKRNPNRWMATIVFSPVLTRKISGETTFYDEVNPFYFGSNSIIYNNYKYGITLGTSFVTMPRGSYNSIMSARNRTQQLLFLQLKAGFAQLNLYEDYFAFTTMSAFQWLCDNRDRYFTGGGNLQFRIGNFYKIKIYSEMYTGNSYVDKQEYPDNAYPDDIPHQMRPKKVKKINRKYAYQDPGQQSFNKARNFICFEANMGALLSFSKGENTWNYPDYNGYLQVVGGRIGGTQNMLQQNFIHNMISIDRDNKDQSGCSTLHQFDYRDNIFPKTFFGIGGNILY